MIIESNKSQGTKITLLMQIISTNREGWLDILKKCESSYSNGRLGSI
jgi:hypothetical protein